MAIHVTDYLKTAACARADPSLQASGTVRHAASLKCAIPPASTAQASRELLPESVATTSRALPPDFRQLWSISTSIRLCSRRSSRQSATRDKDGASPSIPLRISSFFRRANRGSTGARAAGLTNSLFVFGALNSNFGEGDFQRARLHSGLGNDLMEVASREL